MMKIKIIHDLPLVEAIVHFRGRSIRCENVLLDSGSAGTIFNVEKLIEIGVQPEANDMTHTIRGIGGIEFVYSKKIEQVMIGNVSISNFEIEIGAMDYGLELDGIIGFDLMREIGMIINTKQLRVYQSL